MTRKGGEKENEKEKIILAEVDSSLVFKALQKQGLLTPGTPVTITNNIIKIGGFEFKAETAKCMGTHLIYDAEAVEAVGKQGEFPKEAILAAVDEIHQLQTTFK